MLCYALLYLSCPLCVWQPLSARHNHHGGDGGAMRHGHEYSSMGIHVGRNTDMDMDMEDSGGGRIDEHVMQNDG